MEIHNEEFLRSLGKVKHEPITWESLASRIVSFGIPIIIAILGFVLIQVFTWGISVDRSLSEIRSDIRVLKVAAKIAVADPDISNRPRDILSSFGLGVELIPPARAAKGGK